ncbi:hypothetical protein Ciccas_013505, partial [Cichlidogyrus casuarinus]
MNLDTMSNAIDELLDEAEMKDKMRVLELQTMQESLLKTQAEQELRLSRLEKDQGDLLTAVRVDLRDRRQVDSLTPIQAELAEAMTVKAGEFLMRRDRKASMLLLGFPEREKDVEIVRAAFAKQRFPKVISVRRLGVMAREQNGRPKIVKIVFSAAISKKALDSCGSTLAVEGTKYKLVMDKTFLTRKILRFRNGEDKKDADTNRNDSSGVASTRRKEKLVFDNMLYLNDRSI